MGGGGKEKTNGREREKNGRGTADFAMTISLLMYIWDESADDKCDGVGECSEEKNGPSSDGVRKRRDAGREKK